MYSKLTINSPQRRSAVFVVNFELYFLTFLHLFLVFLLLFLNKFAGSNPINYKRLNYLPLQLLTDVQES